MSRRVGLRFMQSVGGKRKLKGFLYGGLQLSPGVIVKVRLSDFSFVTSLTLQPGEQFITSIETDGTYLYVVLDTAPARVVRVRLSTFERVDALDFGAGENVGLCCLIIDNYLYVGLDTSPAKVVKVDLTTFSKVATVTLASGEDYCRTLANYGNYLYAVTYTTPCRVAKINLVTFTRDSALVLSAGDYYARYWQSSEAADNKLYLAVWDGVEQVIKVDLPSFSREDAIIMEAPILPTVLKAIGSYLYGGGEGGEVFKIALATFAYIDKRTDAINSVRGLAESEGYLYAGIYESPASIYKYKLTDFSYVTHLTFPIGFSYLVCMIYSDVG